MAKDKDPIDVAASIRRSIEVSPRGWRRLRFHSLRDLFDFQAWSAQRKELVDKVFAEQGILAVPTIGEAGLDDWVVLSMPTLPVRDDSRPDPRPTTEWFDHLESVDLNSEREVEVHFASPLFHALGYDDDREAAGYQFPTWEGVHTRIAEADLLYFADGRRSVDDADPLVLVECKSSDRAPDAGTGQARGYAYWIKPAYYVITNGNVLVAYNYQGGAVPDVKVLDVKRSELRVRFDEIYQVLNPKAALETRRGKAAKLTGQAPA